MFAGGDVVSWNRAEWCLSTVGALRLAEDVVTGPVAVRQTAAGAFWTIRVARAGTIMALAGAFPAGTETAATSRGSEAQRRTKRNSLYGNGGRTK